MVSPGNSKIEADNQPKLTKNRVFFLSTRYFDTVCVKKATQKEFESFKPDSHSFQKAKLHRKHLF